MIGDRPLSGHEILPTIGTHPEGRKRATQRGLHRKIGRN